jgi:hypothetical protein
VSRREAIVRLSLVVALLLAVAWTWLDWAAVGAFALVVTAGCSLYIGATMQQAYDHLPSRAER